MNIAMGTTPVIAIVVPCYNEEQALPLSVPKMLDVIDRMVADGIASAESYVLLCNDGSKDRTWDVVQRLHLADKRVKGISLAHNRGHQYVLLAGLMTVHGRCDAAISIDADLQDDPMAIVEMVKKFRSGKEIVYGVRSSRAADTWFKRTTAHAFYSFQKKMGLETVYDHADYRLMSDRALGLLGQYGESNLFLRGIVPQIGLENDVVTYSRDERVAGESKYPLAKMLSFSIDGITSFYDRAGAFGGGAACGGVCVHVLFLQRPYKCRVGLDYAFDMGAGIDDSDCNRYSRGIYRQDFQRGQAPSALCRGRRGVGLRD